MSKNISVSKLVDGDDPEWRKALPLLNAAASRVLTSKLSISISDAEDIIQETVLEAIRIFPIDSRKMFEDFRRFTMTIAYRRGIDWLRKQTADKRGGGGVLSLDDKIGEDGSTRLDFIASKVCSIDSHELADFLAALINCRNEKLNPKENNFFHSFYMEGENQREISEKESIPIGSVGTTLKRALGKLLTCLEAKGIQNPL
jgi:RNA polymerase sigma factor (sigma-70 family)